MASARALLAAERAARRLTHPYLSYDQSGRLQCTVCNLNIPAEKLWEPHLRSANHRKNAAAREEGVTVNKKRKIEDEREESNRPKRKFEGTEKDISETEPRPQTIITSRGAKRVKSVRFEDQPTDVTDDIPPLPDHKGNEGGKLLNDPEPLTTEPVPQIVPQQPEPQPPFNSNEPSEDPIDEDEWAAFERDLAPLTSDPITTNPQNHDKYSHATISAAAVSATDLQRQTTQTETKTKRRDYEAEAQEEREEEQARLQDEFEVMEEMEERVRRLREMREKLRVRPAGSRVDPGDATIAVEAETEQLPGRVDTISAEKSEGEGESDDEDDDDIDDWFS